ELRTHSGSCRPDRRMRPGHQARTRTVGQQPGQAITGAYRRTHGHGLRRGCAHGPFPIATTAIRPGQGAPRSADRQISGTFQRPLPPDLWPAAPGNPPPGQGTAVRPDRGRQPWPPWPGTAAGLHRQRCAARGAVRCTGGAPDQTTEL
ncbi:Universal stress protein family COG0589, partial [Pseudomonas sp. FEN]